MRSLVKPLRSLNIVDADTSVFAYAFARRHAPGWAVYSGLSGAAFVVLFFLATVGFSQDPHWVSTAGLLQRLSVGVGWLWLSLLAVRQMTAGRRP